MMQETLDQLLSDLQKQISELRGALSDINKRLDALNDKPKEKAPTTERETQFLTEDGVRLSKGDIFWVVGRNESTWYETISWIKAVDGSEFSNLVNFKRFSTLRIAEEYLASQKQGTVTEEKVGNGTVFIMDEIDSNSKKEFPKDREKYYYLNEYNECCNVIYNPYSADDNARIIIGNCYKTEEEATNELEKRKLVKEINDFIKVENEPLEIVWENTTNQKFDLAYNYITGKWEYTVSTVSTFLNRPTLLNKAVSSKIIEAVIEKFQDRLPLLLK